MTKLRINKEYRMKATTIIIIAALCILLLVFFISCSKASDKKVADAQANAVNAQAAADTAVAQNNAKNDWQVFKTESEAKIAANDKIITDYKAKMSNANGKFKANYNKKIETLEQKNKAMQAKLDGYKDDGKTSWEQFKTDFNKDMDNLGASLKDFATDVKTDVKKK